MKKMILFSQAPADVQYVISLYDINKEVYEITIVVVNVENTFKFLKSLKLKASLHFIPLIGQSEGLKFLLYSFKLRMMYKKLFSSSENAQVYFFSNNYDYVTAFFIEKLQLRNSVNFCDIYNIDGEEVKNKIIFIKIMLIRVLFGIKIKFFRLLPDTAYQYMYNKTRMNEIALEVDRKRLQNYLYTIERNKNRKSLLFFESNGEIDTSFANYKHDLCKILDNISDKYSIYVKPHPRLGYSKLLENYNVEMIPNYIPSELVNTQSFDMVLGIDSTSIATIEHANAYSLINLFEFVDEKRKVYLIDYLDKLSEGKLIYINSQVSLI